MRIIIFADALTYPSKEGVSYHVISQLFAFSRYDDIELILLMCDRGLMRLDQFEKFPWKTILVPDGLYYDYQSVKDLLDSLEPDIIQSYNPYHARLISARYSVENRIPLVMEHHDLESELTHHLHVSRKMSTRAIGIQEEVAAVASLNRTLSAYDEEILLTMLPERAHSFFNLPTIVQDQFKNLSRDTRDKKHVLFLGNGAYPPNQEAIRYIVDHLALVVPDVHFHIVGRLTDQIDNKPNLTGYGMLDDLTGVMSKVSYGIAPLLHGSGLKTKVLTYLSAGLPVIGTDLAFRGFANDESLIESPLDEIAKVLSARSDSYDPTEAVNARNYFLRNYSEAVSIEKLLKKYRELTYVAAINDGDFVPIKRDDAYLVWLRELRAIERSPVIKPVFINFT